MYSVEEIKELLRAFDESKATKLEIMTESGELFTLSQKTSAPAAADAAVPVQTEAKPAEESSIAPFTQPQEKSDDNTRAVTSPMVGVFYSAPSPDSEPYVSVGTKVSKGDVLCLIEAMKLMNEVTAEQSGEIAEICVENGDVVEYGQPLFRIR